MSQNPTILGHVSLGKRRWVFGYLSNARDCSDNTDPANLPPPPPTTKKQRRLVKVKEKREQKKAQKQRRKIIMGEKARERALTQVGSMP